MSADKSLQYTVHFLGQRGRELKKRNLTDETEQTRFERLRVEQKRLNGRNRTVDTGRTDKTAEIERMKRRTNISIQAKAIESLREVAQLN